MIRYYLDSSIAVHGVVRTGDPRARRWLKQVSNARDPLFSSKLLELEVTRALRREGHATSDAGPLIDRLSLVNVDDVVLRLAGAIERHVKSLDAIHLASCSLLGSSVVLVTNDRRMADAAGDLGIECLDPLA